MIQFTAYVKPEPQGSAKAFVIAGKARVTSDNTKLKPFRSEVTRCAMLACRDNGVSLPYAEKHRPVEVRLQFSLRRPESLPRRHIMPARKPDLDKLVRATLDALTGVLFHDDGQVVMVSATKVYSPIEGVEVTAEVLG